MASAARVLKYLSFGLVAFYAVFGCAFIIGEVLTDPGGLRGVLLTLSWLVPMAALVVCAALWPRMATNLLTIAAAIVALFILIDLAFDIVHEDDVGPVGAIAAFAVAVPLGVLGLRRPVHAGWLLVLVGAPLLASLHGSAMAVAVPVVLVGGLYLLAGYRK
ncbi:hypothetical protein [Amycolatopsis alkalitolerans]|uniref:Uncharacterized protein n=1 Tax=Amycolatopsis alkalitolerans TaxID=2547244 RepID=A0A5C4LTB7_9PSEU|nr:hypothetical protein [Amycolatopsis alkalitolerans]TNC20665.1 hypothetical protein FG385_30320 [Amycolatopsis alkalitolerans]